MTEKILKMKFFSEILNYFEILIVSCDRKLQIPIYR